MRQRLSSVETTISYNKTELQKSLDSSKEKDVLKKQKWLMTWEETPNWLRYSFILNGYRPITNSYYQCFESLFYIHNQTGNIYSHILGALIFSLLCLATYFWLDYHSAQSQWVIPWQDYLFLFTFLICMTICFTLSSAFHLFQNHSPDVNQFWVKCDLVGAGLGGFSMSFPLIYYGFYCEPMWQLVYMGSLTVVGLRLLPNCFTDHYHTNEYKSTRGWTCVFIGLGSIIPIVHYLIKVGMTFALEFVPVRYIGLALIFDFTALFFYLSHFPEKYAPGKFNYWFHSHQFFHVFVTLTAIAGHLSIINFIKYQYSIFGTCP